MARAGVEIARYESDLACFERVSRAPAPVLRGQVRAYTGYEEQAQAPRKLREIPSGDVTLIISFGPSLSIIEPRGGSPVRRQSFVAGVHDGYAITETPQRQHGAMLAGELGCSRKHIAERFREEVGVPAKTAARVLRFKRQGGLPRWCLASHPGERSSGPLDLGRRPASRRQFTGVPY